MYRLFRCIPIFRVFFLLKVKKECVYVIMLKIVLVLVKNVFFGLKKGASGLVPWIAQKHTSLYSHTLREKCPYSELFWSAFSRIRTEKREILHISLYSVRMRENADQNNSECGHFLRSDICCSYKNIVTILNRVFLNILLVSLFFFLKPRGSLLAHLGVPKTGKI